jgi:hypothetical protein
MGYDPYTLAPEFRDVTGKGKAQGNKVRFRVYLASVGGEGFEIRFREQSCTQNNSTKVCSDFDGKWQATATLIHRLRPVGRSVWSECRMYFLANPLGTELYHFWLNFFFFISY